MRNYDVRWQISSKTHFRAGSHRFRNINISNVLPRKYRISSRNTAFAGMTFGDEYKSQLKIWRAVLHWLSPFPRYYIIQLILTSKISVKVTEYSIRSDAI